MDEVAACVEEEEADGFVAELGHFWGEVLVDEFGAVHGVFAELFLGGAASEFEGGGDECGFGGAESAELLAEFFGTAVGELA